MVSGGKDSVMNLMMCERYGHTVVALANLLPAADTTEELDSFMYQTVRTITSAGLCTGVGVCPYTKPTLLQRAFRGSGAQTPPRRLGVRTI